MPKKRTIKKQWVYVPPKPPKPEVPEKVKEDVKDRADEFIENVLKPSNIRPPPQKPSFNYLVDIFSKWWRNYFYFCAEYHCPGPRAISPSFGSKLARLEYTTNGTFHLSYMRHTGKWHEIRRNLSLEECLEEIKGGGLFTP